MTLLTVLIRGFTDFEIMPQESGLSLCYQTIA
jgi:hypothetical protein